LNLIKLEKGGFESSTSSIFKCATVRTLRHSLATHLIENVWHSDSTGAFRTFKCAGRYGLYPCCTKE